MVHKLLEIIKTVLGDELPNNEIADARIKVEHPIGVEIADTPLVALYLGMVRINQESADTVSSAVRPQERKDRFLVNVNAPQGPFNLSKTPMEDSLTCQVVFKENELGETRRMMMEHKDFTIDYINRRLTFSTSTIGASSVLVTYVFPGIFTVREFHQDFFIDVFDNPIPHLERLSSVINAMVLTNHDSILEEFNVLNKTQHSIGNYQSEHTLRSIRFLEMTPLDSLDSPSVWSLKYEVSGMLKVTKEISSGYGIIEKIVSPGRTGEGVDVDVNLG
jgi:hypothetical protein